MFDLENVFQSLRVQRSQWWHSVDNNNLNKSYRAFIYVSSHRFGDIKVCKFDLDNWGQGHEGPYSQRSHSAVNINVYKSPWLKDFR